MTEVISPACKQAHLACRIFSVFRPHVSRTTFLGLEGDKLISQIIKPAFDDYLNFFLDLIVNAKRISIERSSKVLNGQKKYMRYRAKKDPARGMLRSFFGNAWTENYINNILFDLQ